MFIKSQSSQAALLKLSTGSDWTHVGMAFKQKEGWEIIEAVQPVKWTSLYSFIRRSRELSFEIKRPTFAFDAKKVKEYAETQLGKDYDLIFAWDNKRWYCTELVYKAYVHGAQEELGALQSVGELNLADPRVIREAKKRFEGYGMSFSLEEWKLSKVTTPVEMMKAGNLQKVINQSRINDLQDCVKK